MNTLNLKFKLLRNFFANAYGQSITVIIQLISIPLFLHYWGIELYGEWLILSAIPAYLSLSDIGFTSVAANDMTMRVANGEQSGALEIFQSIWVFICLISVIISTILAYFITALPINDIFSISYISLDQTTKILFVLMLYILVGLQSSLLSAGFRAVGHYAYATVMNNTIRLVEWLFSMVALALDGSVFTVALAALLVRIAGIFLLWINLRIKAPWLVLGYQLATFHKIKLLLKPAIAFTAFPLGLALSLQGMVLLIGHLLGASSVVIFTTYRTVTRLLVQFITMINQALWPELSAAYGAGKINLLIKMYHKGSFISFWIAIVSISVLGFTGDWLIGVWTQHVIQPHHDLLLLLLLVTFLNVLWQTSWVVLMATNMHQRISVIFIFSSVAGLLISYFTIPMFGINAAGVALAVVELPLLYLAIKSTLSLLDDSWQSYVKKMLRFPFGK